MAKIYLENSKSKFEYSTIKDDDYKYHVSDKIVDGKRVIQLGCFSGTLEELEKRIEELDKRCQN